MTTSRRFASVALTALVATVLSAPAFALNPQPLPPKAKFLNPQPLPPKAKFLNPQPLPPKALFQRRLLMFR